MGSFRRGIRIFRSQEVKNESRPSFFRKSYPIEINLLICYFSLLVFSLICSGGYIGPFVGSPS